MLRDRAPLTVGVLGTLIVLGYLADTALREARPAPSRAQHLLTVEPWYCRAHDPERQALVTHSVETFHTGGTLHGHTRLEDATAGRVLLEFSYRGVWQFDDPWLTEAIEEYRYLHVDDASFTPAQLAAIEVGFGEPEVSRVHALTEAQLVYGELHAPYQCQRLPEATSA